VTKEVMRTLRLEDFTEEQRVKMADLRPDTQVNLSKAGVEELMPVQQVTYKLFLEGGEIVVK
jgi:superfamily II DNA/RNA helicase